jgi:hypothetical protein
MSHQPDRAVRQIIHWRRSFPATPTDLPPLDTGGEIVGMVAAKLNALKFVKSDGQHTGEYQFAIKTGALRDFLDNSVVPYQTADAKKLTSDIARNARAFTLLISCTAAEQSASAKKSDN